MAIYKGTCNQCLQTGECIICKRLSILEAMVKNINKRFELAGEILNKATIAQRAGERQRK